MKTLRNPNGGIIRGPRGGVYHKSASGKIVSGPPPREHPKKPLPTTPLPTTPLPKVDHAKELGDKLVDTSAIGARRAVYAHHASNPTIHREYPTPDHLFSAVQRRINEVIDFETQKKHGGLTKKDIVAFEKAGTNDPIQIERIRTKVHDWMAESGSKTGALDLRAGATEKTGKEFLESVKSATHLSFDERSTILASSAPEMKKHQSDVETLAKMSQEGLPEKITVYRGTRKGDPKVMDEITSFTTDRKVAEATGPLVISATIPRSAVVFHHDVVKKMGFHDPAMIGLATKEKEVVVRTAGIKISD